MSYIQERLLSKTETIYKTEIKNLPLNKSPFCILGNGKTSRDLQQVIYQDTDLYPHMKGGVLQYKEEIENTGSCVYPLLGTLEDMQHIANKHNITQVIITTDGEDYHELLKMTDICSKIGLKVYIASSSLSLVARLVTKDKNSEPIIILPQNHRSPVWNFGRRIFDIFASSIAILITSPIWLVSSIAIKLSSPGPVFYKREVVGKDNKTFDFYKFRTMYHNNNDSAHQEYVKKLIKGEMDDQETYKIEKDPRITSIGEVLRRFSLDELPQFLNVLKGDMSVIGPRPCNTDEYEHYKEWHKRRTQVKPGITGLWQVRARNKIKYDEMVMMDIYYIHNRSFLLDMKIALETIPVMLFGKGAH
ncbi:exopolysaccharide biosynthesis polyprenyl glycosylphosphotransferase [Candidatus Poribacteria bacterium]|nr:exopolysaccharide biosynthesis polyprenyl glycosylphosphotransferase [Candidatus Poribacteria bacterium]